MTDSLKDQLSSSMEIARWKTSICKPHLELNQCSTFNFLHKFLQQNTSEFSGAFQLKYWAERALKTEELFNDRATFCMDVRNQSLKRRIWEQVNLGRPQMLNEVLRHRLSGAVPE